MYAGAPDNNVSATGLLANKSSPKLKQNIDVL